ncbi:hypothetical protein R3P38DRAFT_1193708 [Favolaschia claudopus]|uniref:Zn(2)-C6 fungal-type domain-containing protein n=1 Tax=Favolaschia claudopus TaxID=2862362 RepID=A0AAW0E336_9AGAR
MSSSSTPTQGSNPFMKRRRAYVACGACRQRKVKCVTLSEVDYRPCARCSQKGLKCEYFTMPGDDGQAWANETPSPEFQAPPGQWTPQPITPPSAGINEFLPAHSSSRSARRGTVPPTGSSGRYRPATPGAASAYPAGQFSQQSSHTQPSYGGSSMQPYPSQYYSGGQYPVDPNPGHSNNPYYAGNYPQQYMPQPQASGLVAPWSQAAQCICPPGQPCYCGAGPAR